ncbi:hypothetical protein MMC17_000246 [Xylographa soralifera]|nr:hypothetical protein [Xylographa soralifera]
MISSLLELPNEVLLLIVSVTANADLDNLTSSCKVVRALASNALSKHQERKRLYAKVMYGDPQENKEETTWAHPIIMLHDFLAQDLFCYPSEISIHDQAFESADGALQEVDRALESFDKDFGPLVRACPYLNSDEGLVNAVLEKRHRGPILGFLLALLPNLTALHITDFNKTSEGSESLQAILKNVLHIGYGPNASTLDATPPLSKLRNMTFTRSDEGALVADLNLFIYAPLFYIPSMRSIRADFITPNDRWSYPGVRSNIEELVLNDADIDADDVESYIENTTSLKHFGCHFGWNHMSNVDPEFKPWKIVQKLRDCARHSLRTLSLGGNEVHRHGYPRQGALFIGSLRDFPALETIQVACIMCIPPPDPVKKLRSEGNATSSNRSAFLADRPLKLVDMFPPSTIRIVFGFERSIEGDEAFNNEAAVAMLEDLAESKAERLPNLKSIKFGWIKEIFEREDQALLKACRNAGVEIVCTNGAVN